MQVDKVKEEDRGGVAKVPENYLPCDPIAIN
jgi:hypothetical protein